MEIRYNKSMNKAVKPLLNWYRKNKRNLPWRKDTDPYHIWISEIMLQQTRIETVIEYYERFMKYLPDIQSLSKIEEDQLLKLWEGLGYYTRARNLKKAALVIVEKHNGVFPKDYEDILKLPGIGEYTAGAISSICFQEKAPCIDGNVMRVYARYQNKNIDIQNSKEKKKVVEEIKKVLPKEAGEFNQAIMELGETICIPNGIPKCLDCPLKKECKAHLNKREMIIPEKRKKKEKKEEKYTVLLIHYQNLFAIQKRKEDLLKNMWEFPNKEGFTSTEEITKEYKTNFIKEGIHTTHIFTHKKWIMISYTIEVTEKDETYTWLTLEEIEKEYALPTAFKPFFDYLKKAFPK